MWWKHGIIGKLTIFAGMNRILKTVRHYPLTVVTAAVIWVVCLMPVPETPLSHVSLVDKWTHVAMYCMLCSIVWTEYIRGHKSIVWGRAFVVACVAPLIMGGLIEIAQATCTGGRRSGDWLDFVADGVGVLLGLPIGILLAKCLARR
uniref:VanZ family protein n=1 Tax=Prevotella sp. GTC17254 TaxID=3236794 RepID=A0AB33IWG6_9BACT